MSDDIKTKRYLPDTALSCDEKLSIIDKPALDVGADGRITYFGQASKAPNADVVEIPISGLIMPGLVNTHAHTPMTLMRSAGQGLPLLRWLNEAIFPREAQLTDDDVFWGMTLGAAELLKCGVTTTCEMYMWEDPTIQAAKEIGIRLLMCPTIMDLPDQPNKPSTTERIQQVIDIYDKEHDPNSIITVGFGPHSAYNLGIEGCVQAAEAAAERDALYHIHLSESQAEDAELREAHGGISTTKILHKAGALEGRTLAAHSVWLDEGDHEIYVDKNISVAHCPVSNMRMGSGNAEVVRLREAGIRVGLGTDGPVSNGSLDMWFEMKLAPLIARNSALDETILNAEDTIAMATSEGGKALGLDVGILEEGKWADFIHIDTERSPFVPSNSPHELLGHLAWAGKSHVQNTWVAGRHVVKDGVCVNINEADAIAKVKTIGQRISN